MAGLLSTVGTILKLASNVSDDGVAKGALKTLEDKNVHLLRADGSMLKLLGKYIVEPVAVVSDDLKDVEELDAILGLHMDLFTGYYMQIFDILREHYGLSVTVVVDALATDNGGLSRAVNYGLKNGINFSGEDADTIDYLGELLRNADLTVEDAGYLASESNTAATARAAEVARQQKITVDAHVSQRGRNQADTEHNDAIRARLGSVNPADKKYFVNRDAANVPTGLSEQHSDLLIPNAIQRTINITTELVNQQPGTDGKYYTRTVIIPVTIKLAVIFTSKENILNAIKTASDDYGFSNRLDSYRAGAISLADFVLASDIITKYKQKKLKDKDGLLEIMKSRELSSNSKILSNGFAGFEKFYNMFIISPETRSVIEREVHGKLSTPKGKDKFLERSNGLSVTVVDPDYERVQIMVKDIRGKTDLSFRNVTKKDKNGSDYSEIIKALMASKPPAF